jgi:putative NADPH-quinone reductase
MSDQVRSRILVIDGHPDSSDARFIHALASAYEAGAVEAGHETKRVRIAALDFPLLRSNEDFVHGYAPESIRSIQELLSWCTHLLILYPLWLGSAPALLKAFLEQCLRPGFAFSASDGHGLPKKLLKGKSARIVVTMGMPAFFYRWYFRSHSLKSLERNVLGFVGFAPVRATVIGSVEGSAGRRARWLARMRMLGAKAS